MAYSVEGKFTLHCANAETMKRQRLVCIDSSGNAALPNASTDANVLAVVGVSENDPYAGDIAVRGFDGGVVQVGVVASATVSKGDLLYMAGTSGLVQTDTDGWLVGVSLGDATSGSSEIAAVPAILWKPIAVESGT